MRKFPRNGTVGRPLGAAARRRRWLATHLQERRRIRHAQHVPVSGLRLGLHSFYEPQPGRTHCRSWGETETLPTNPLEGMAWPVAVAGSPGYAAEHQVFYWLFPFRQSGAQRVYAGQMRESGWITGDEINPFRIEWPAWSGAGWMTGVTILQTRVDLAVKGWREVSAATLQAGWVDDGSGWDYTGLPHGWSNPLPVARALWCVPAAGAAVETMPVVSSGLGGWAFDSSAGRLLARVGDDELMRDLEGTTAFWVAPDLYTGDQLSRVGSVMSVEGELYYVAESWGVEVWDEGAAVSLGDPDWDDWYLVVHRMDPTLDRLTVDLFRQRDGAHESTWCEMNWLSWRDALTPASDYFLGGYLAVQVMGGSYWWSRYGSGRFDRMGFWRRALSDAEVLELFNNGLGWRPD